MERRYIYFIILFVLVVFLVIFPFILIDTGDRLIKFSYDGDVSQFEDVSCYDESYFYVEERDVSISSFDFKKFLFFHVTVMEYEIGNVCDTEYLLEESYIDKFLNNAVIMSNEKNISLDKLISGKSAIVGNTRYFGNDYENMIEYILDGEYEIMYVFYDKGLLVIQVGLSDEGPKFIAYK